MVRRFKKKKPMKVAYLSPSLFSLDNKPAKTCVKGNNIIIVTPTPNIVVRGKRRKKRKYLWITINNPL